VTAPRARLDVLLYSARPGAHGNLLRALRQRGSFVRTVRMPQRLPRLLSLSPAVVLVDFVHPAGVTAGVLHALIGVRGTALLFALHDGVLPGSGGPVAELAVDGFVGVRDWASLADTIASRYPTSLVH